MSAARFEGHTPGPWKATQNQHAPACGIVRDADNNPVADCGYMDNGWPKRNRTVVQANARLIAAAPDLLASNERLREALTWCVGYLGHNDCKPEGVVALEKARAALAGEAKAIPAAPQKGAPKK